MTLKQAPSDIETQFYFFECLNKDMLNAFLQRVATNEIINDIHTYNNIENNIKIKAVIGSINTAPSVYISFHENNTKICHVTFHLCPSSINKKTKGPLHVVNNSSNKKTQRLKINRLNNGSLLFKLGTAYQEKEITNMAKIYASYVFKVMDDYFNIISPKYLGSISLNTNLYPRLNYIQQKKNNALIKLGKTRKNIIRNNSNTKYTGQSGKN
jgi:hypothetical protein